MSVIYCCSSSSLGISSSRIIIFCNVTVGASKKFDVLYRTLRPLIVPIHRWLFLSTAIDFTYDEGKFEPSMLFIFLIWGLPLFSLKPINPDLKPAIHLLPYESISISLNPNSSWKPSSMIWLSSRGRSPRENFCVLWKG